MLKKSRRLVTKQFNEVMAKGRVSRTPLFVVRTLGGFKDTRLAAVMPQKIAKKAVIRNMAKRTIYQAVESIFDKIRNGTHALIIAKTDISSADIMEVSAELLEVLR
ncbi:ribonuclease P protein component [Patescibacteria group bacterium]|nr:ribonuclease P protein component [Patescibacteria group bacterium]MDE1946641.1 ribonuclease P protein component [Patescibacteria group bacterium]MDE2010594.1 ribonuclease P protein component [Patescibacteria group bacterium]MDE2232959.1 ribonuclease P protein component [Patescibacteria group bacterium]